VEYQVWTKDEYEGYKKVDCGDLEAARVEIIEALKRGAEPFLTMTVPYRWDIKIEEVMPHEAGKGKT